jgi:hypothetical protein
MSAGTPKRVVDQSPFDEEAAVLTNVFGISASPRVEFCRTGAGDLFDQHRHLIPSIADLLRERLVVEDVCESRVGPPRLPYQSPLAGKHGEQVSVDRACRVRESIRQAAWKTLPPERIARAVYFCIASKSACRRAATISNAVCCARDCDYEFRRVRDVLDTRDDLRCRNRYRGQGDERQHNSGVHGNGFASHGVSRTGKLQAMRLCRRVKS